jgi:competence protein ComEC
MRAKIFTIWLVFYLAGSGLGTYFVSAPKSWLILGAILCFLSFLIFNNRYFWGIVFGIGIFFISVYSFQAKSLNLDRINESLARVEINYIAVINEPPVISENAQQLTLTIIDEDNIGYHRKIVVYTRRFPTYKFGEKVEFKAKVKAYDEKSGRYKKDNVVGSIFLNNIDKIGYEDGLSIKIYSVLYSIRAKVNSALSVALPSREAGLASGLILGEKAFLSADTKRLLQASGTMHIIALSGYNITIILSLFQFLRARYSRLTNLLVPLVFVLIFVVMTGAAPSIVRAAIMGLMPVLARCFGRGSSSFVTILFSAVIMLILNPFLLIYDVGFQLSFLALTGMMYLGPILYEKLSFLPKYISFPISETLGAQLTSLPILIYYFGNVSVISPISNLIILSLVPLCMLIAFFIGAIGAIVPLFAKIFAIPGFIILKLFNDLIAFFGNLPFAAYQVEIKNPILIICFYFLLFDLWFIFRKNKNHSLYT